MPIDDHLVRRYLSPEGAAAYRGKYRRSLTRRLSNRRELAMVRAALAHAAPRGPLLDCPCGAGRLVPTLLEHASHVTGADFSPAMVAQARDALDLAVSEGRVELVVASADALPFDDAAFDTVVCHRLIHHVPEVADRAKILAELARVSGRNVLLSFNDASTWKMRSQIRRRRKRRRVAWSPDEIAAEAGRHGLALEQPVHRLCGLFSLVAVAVLRKVD